MIARNSRVLLPLRLVAQPVCSESTFRCSDIQVTKTKTPGVKPPVEKLLFGKTFSDHMLVSKWTSSHGWDKPQIKPVGPLDLHPAAKALHYAQEIFEGMKAYRGVDGIVRLFRPEMNGKRMLISAERSCLPLYDLKEWVSCVKRFVKEDIDWVPPCDPNNLTSSPSLYIRPFMFGSEPTLGVSPANEVMFIVMAGPVGPYFASGFKPVSLLADPKLVRAWPGGTGYTKMGSNYAPTLALQKNAAQQGCQQVLWLFGKDRLITEVGTMNMFMVLRGTDKEFELITPPISSGLILPGVTRNSILELAKDWKDVKVTEREVSLDELLALNKENKVVEVFGAGTACIVCPVAEIVYEGERHSVLPPENSVLLSQRAVDELLGIQFGKPDLLKKRPDWVMNVE